MVEKKQKVVNGSSGKAGGHSGGSTTNGSTNGAPVRTKEDTLIARKRFIA